MAKRPPTERLFPEAPESARRGPLERALGRTVTSMRTAGQLEPADELTVVAVRAACRLVDGSRVDPEATWFTEARCLAELGAWHDRLALLRGLDGPDSLDELLRELSAGVGDGPQP